MLNATRFYSPSRQSPERDGEFAAGERRLAVLGLVFSLCVVIAKVAHANRADLYNAFVERRLDQQEIVSNGRVMFTHAWVNVVKYSWLWFPAVCGAGATWFTWLMIFLDSCVPGVQPPSPLSPSKYKMQSGRTFHLNYVFAIMVGVFIFGYMLTKQITLEF